MVRVTGSCGDAALLLKLGPPAIALAILAVAATGARETPAPVPPAMPETAIDMLGEAWTLVPEVAAPHAAAAAPSDRVSISDARPAPGPRPPVRASLTDRDGMSRSLRPLQRPALASQASDIVAGALSETHASSSVVAAEPLWIVRSLREGRVVAELPLGDALALLHARSSRR